MSDQDGYAHEPFPTDGPAVVTCGLPYANGDLHIGHLRTYVGGDVYSRALESLGQQTAFVSGSDMHGTPIAVQAIEEGVDPEAFALEWHEQYAETFPKFGVEFDNYGHTHEETNRELTYEIVERLESEGYVYEKEIKVAWDPVDDQPLPDRYVEGTCPYCGADARGDECDEGCGRHLEPGEIEDPVSTISGNPAEYRDRTHKFFRVSELADYLDGFLDRLEGTSNARNQPRQWLEDGLQDWCITRDLDWGFDYPDVSGASPEEGDAPPNAGDDLVLYVWVDAPIEYVASTKQYTERVGADEYDWEEVWKDDGEIVHVIGRDIIQHHTIFWPAMLEVAEYAEPRAVMASGFMTLGGKGFSTSRDRAVWAEEYLDEGFHPDLLRYYLATNGGFQQDVDFSWEKFRDRVNNELVGTVGNFLYRSLLFAQRNFEGTPDAEVSDDVEERIERAVDEFRAGVNDYSVRAIGEASVSLARFGNEYIQRNEPWNLVGEDDERAAQVIRDCVQIAKAVAVLFEPVAPGTSQRLWEQIDEEGSVHDVTTDEALEAPPREFGPPEELYEKIDEERVEELNAKLDARVAEATEGDADEPDENDETGDGSADADPDAADEGTDPELEPVESERVSFEEFQELDLRVGEITAADPIEDADKLVQLMVDIGVETRSIVAGLKQLHDVDDLPGTRVVVVANLERAELFGRESNGMVLAAGDEADLLTTHGDAALGERVR
ncbi:methionine--tRNA ligase [Candidatus Halobonum tyrrellensis]|uniref:Methionine--tRNA ligase n=1 Tax=Candidatus Halobonum tyrrellensis G22 TaxID=1324957 RepID=V4HLT6_9EURY|nr:methionine--tRNA ligase [Candidatus Halobonum tyrrellensis]ESP88869.1 methionyl-tRNA ligase [Candidatus Halobonum tyrrellensis G22]